MKEEDNWIEERDSRDGNYNNDLIELAMLWKQNKCYYWGNHKF